MLRGLVGRVLMASACLWVCSLKLYLVAATAQTASCVGNQSNTDVNGDTCSSSSASGPQGNSTASAQASGPIASNATSFAGNNSNASATANNGSGASSDAFDRSTAGSWASDGSTGGASASSASSANAVAAGGSLAEAQSDTSSAANANGSAQSNALATADSASTAQSAASDISTAGTDATGGGFAQAQAMQNSNADASANNHAAAFAEALNNSIAAASDNTPGASVCAFAINGSAATASDTAPPTCAPGPTDGIAVAVSPLGSCGPVADSPCAALAANTSTLVEVGSYTLDVADNLVRLINPSGSANPAVAQSAAACAMIYVFDSDEEMGECCGCPISPAGVLTASVKAELTDNWAGSRGRPVDGVLMIVGTAPNVALVAAGGGASNGSGCASSQSQACNSGCDPTGSPGFTPASERPLLGSRVAAVSSAPGAPQLTELPLDGDGSGDPTTLLYLERQCGALIGNGSGAGICSCPGGD